MKEEVEDYWRIIQRSYTSVDMPDVRFPTRINAPVGNGRGDESINPNIPWWRVYLFYEQ